MLNISRQGAGVLERLGGTFARAPTYNINHRTKDQPIEVTNILICEGLIDHGLPVANTGLLPPFMLIHQVLVGEEERSEASSPTST